jgi:uncharacterized membrane protein YfcA
MHVIRVTLALLLSAAPAAAHEGRWSLKGSSSYSSWLQHLDTPEEVKEYVVDDTKIEAKSPGLAFRLSKSLDNRDKGLYADWGSVVKGVDQGDGWLKVGSRYLPLAVNNHTVLRELTQDNPGPIVKEYENRRWWGFPNYIQDLDEGLRSWQELRRSHGHLSMTCTEMTRLQRCGNDFICKEGVCSQCEISRDCPDEFRCASGGYSRSYSNVCVPRSLVETWHWPEVVCTILVIITAMLSAAAGMGGGGVYVPLLLLLLGFSTKEAVPLSQAMIVGGATVNVIMFCGERHPKYPTKPRIDYDVIMMLNPGLAAGVTLGVMCNIISPQWLIVCILVVTLVSALQKSWTKGISQWRKESAALAAIAASSSGPGGSGGPGGVPAKPQNIQIKLADFRTAALLAQDNQRNLSLIFGCWAVFFAVNLVKAPQCSGPYWMQMLGLVGLCFVFTAAGANTIRNKADGECAEGMLQWTEETLWMYPLMSMVAGFLGGFLGIGGGIIMGPLLLELGMAPEASQATTAMFVWLSSSLATIQFVVMGKAMPEYAIWFTTWVVIFTFIGQTGIDYMLRKYQRSSLIVLSIAGIIAGSLLMMSAIGTRDIIGDLMRGAYMGFSPMQLCM